MSFSPNGFNKLFAWLCVTMTGISLNKKKTVVHIVISVSLLISCKLEKIYNFIFN